MATVQGAWLCNDQSPDKSVPLSSSTSAPLAVGKSENSELSSLFTERNADDIIPMVKKAEEAGAKVLLGDVEGASPTLL
jgi:hypothetical protein